MPLPLLPCPTLADWLTAVTVTASRKCPHDAWRAVNGVQLCAGVTALAFNDPRDAATDTIPHESRLY